MRVNIRGKYGEAAVLDIERFSMSKYSNEFQVWPYQGEHTIDMNALFQLQSVGFKQSNFSTAIWVIPFDSISHFSSEL